jgi:hypothetical protein
MPPYGLAYAVPPVDYLPTSELDSKPASRESQQDGHILAVLWRAGLTPSVSSVSGGVALRICLGATNSRAGLSFCPGFPAMDEVYSKACFLSPFVSPGLRVRVSPGPATTQEPGGYNSLSTP